MSCVERRQIEFAGRTWAYFTGGDESAALLAFAGSLGACPTLVNTLLNVIPGYRVVAPLYPEMSGVTEMLDAVEVLLSAEQIEPAIVYGASFGGIFAQSWTRRHTDRAHRLILSGCGAPDPQRARGNRRWLKRLQWIPASVLRGGLRLALRKLLRDVAQDRDAWRKDYMEIIRGLQRSNFASLYRVSIDFDEISHWTAGDLRDWNGTILILEGGADRIAGPTVRESLRTLYPEATVRTIPEAGHALLLSHTGQARQIVRDWLQE